VGRPRFGFYLSFYRWFHRLRFLRFLDPILKDMGWTRAETALANSLRSIESGVSAPVFGFLIDRIGTRKCIFVGITIIAAALVMMSRVTNIYAYYGTFMLLSTGMSAGLSNADTLPLPTGSSDAARLALGLCRFRIWPLRHNVARPGVAYRHLRLAERAANFGPICPFNWLAIVAHYPAPPRTLRSAPRW